MGFSVDVNYPKIDIPKTEAAIHKTMTKFIIDTLKVWVLESTDTIHVWSGASRASFIKLAGFAQTTIEISPVATSQIPLGIQTSIGTIISKPKEEYGWDWASDLSHIQIVDDNYSGPGGFEQAGFKAIDKLQPVLPDLVTK